MHALYSLINTGTALVCQGATLSDMKEPHIMVAMGSRPALGHYARVVTLAVDLLAERLRRGGLLGRGWARRTRSLHTHPLMQK